MVNIILANVGTLVTFRTGNPEDERMMLPLFSPYIEQGEISNLPAYNFYAKLSAIYAQEPVSGQTLLLENEGSDEVKAEAIEYSRNVFAKKQEMVTPDRAIQKTPVTKKLDKTKVQPARSGRKTKAKTVSQGKTTTSRVKPPGF